jgi:HD-like signal output (HDOD) protein/GAF domain-containing protein
MTALAQPHPHARTIEQLIGHIAMKGELPSAARIVQRLQAAVSSDTCSTLDVARVILSDPGLSAKILRLVNSVQYVQRSGPVSTISRAVLVLGFEAIRDLTTSVVVLEAILRDARSRAGMTRHVARSFRCGLLAQALAHQVGWPQTEEAYLLGLFADLGTLCLASYCTEDYERATELASARGLPLADALAETFGMTPSDVAAALFDHWGFPLQYTSYFRRVPGDRHPTSSSGKLVALVELADDYTAALDARDGYEPRGAADDLAARFAALFALPAERFTAAVADANESWRARAQTLGIAVEAGADTADGGVTSTDDAHACAAGPLVTPSDGVNVAMLDMISEITRSVLEHEDINTTLAMVVEGVARAGGFDTVFFALLNPQKDRITGRLGLGDHIRERLEALSQPVHEGSGMLATTVMTRTPQLVVRGTPASNMPLGSWATYPIVVRDKAIGVLAAGRTAEPPVSQRELPIMHLFGVQAALALERAAL